MKSVSHFPSLPFPVIAGLCKCSGISQQLNKAIELDFIGDPGVCQASFQGYIYVQLSGTRRQGQDACLPLPGLIGIWAPEPAKKGTKLLPVDCPGFLLVSCWLLDGKPNYLKGISSPAGFSNSFEPEPRASIHPPN